MHGALVDLLIEGERVNNFVTLSLKNFVILNMIYFIKRKKIQLSSRFFISKYPSEIKTDLK